MHRVHEDARRHTQIQRIDFFGDGNRYAAIAIAQIFIVEALHLIPEKNAAVRMPDDITQSCAQPDRERRRRGRNLRRFLSTLERFAQIFGLAERYSQHGAHRNAHRSAREGSQHRSPSKHAAKPNAAALRKISPMFSGLVIFRANCQAKSRHVHGLAARNSSSWSIGRGVQPPTRRDETESPRSSRAAIHPPRKAARRQASIAETAHNNAMLTKTDSTSKRLDSSRSDERSCPRREKYFRRATFDRANCDKRQREDRRGIGSNHFLGHAFNRKHLLHFAKRRFRGTSAPWRSSPSRSPRSSRSSQSASQRARCWA